MDFKVILIGRFCNMGEPLVMKVAPFYCLPLNPRQVVSVDTYVNGKRYWRTMGKSIVNASVKSEIDVLMHHQAVVYAPCKFQSSNTTAYTLVSRNTLYHWIHLSTINTGDISNHNKRPLSSHTSLVYPPLRVAAMLENAWRRVNASSVAPVK